jgi:3-oxoacyl-[acyl-carrier protein] reductase
VPGDMDALFSGLTDELGGRSLDIVVNNAGGHMGTGSIEQTTPEEFDPLFALNVRAPFFIIQRALPILSAGGRIINISSADTRIAIRAELAYSMAKGRDQHPGQNPGPRSRRTRHHGEHRLPGRHRHQGEPEDTRQPRIAPATAALGRIGQPADIADIVAFLATHDARWITGHLIDATGGTFLRPRL